MNENKLLLGDCLNLMKKMPDNSVDAVITDPPYGISFMGKKWDYDVPTQEIWEECLRVLKPGGYLLSFASTRTQHRIATKIEDAGFEIRDSICYVYGSGFPKSLNIGKMIDKLQGNERELVGKNPNERINNNERKTVFNQRKECLITKGSSGFDGFGTNLKPSYEPITMARKPLSENTIAQNVLKWGTGGINIDACRVATNEKITNHSRSAESAVSKGKYGDSSEQETHQTSGQSIGRFPGNFIHDGSDEVLDLFPSPHSSGWTEPDSSDGDNQDNPTKLTKNIKNGTHYIDSGSAARFFYCAKPSKSERNAGCEGLEKKQSVGGGGGCGIGNYLNDVNSASGKFGSEKAPANNIHPTVKPIALMEYLIKMVSKEGDIVLDPFAGSGTTGLACINLKRNYILMERDESYFEILKKRIKHQNKKEKPLI